MSEKEKRERTIRHVQDQILKSKFISEVGQKARVERTDARNEVTDQLREVLREMGHDLSTEGVIPKGLEYQGALCVFVYKNENLKVFTALTLNDLHKMTFDIADAGLRELTGNTLVAFGRNRQKLRSGF